MFTRSLVHNAQALLYRFITKFGVPRELITDQGGTFIADLIKQFCKLLKINKLQTSGYHPMSNGNNSQNFEQNIKSLRKQKPNRLGQSLELCVHGLQHQIPQIDIFPIKKYSSGPNGHFSKK